MNYSITKLNSSEQSALGPNFANIPGPILNEVISYLDDTAQYALRRTSRAGKMAVNNSSVFKPIITRKLKDARGVITKVDHLIQVQNLSEVPENESPLEYLDRQLKKKMLVVNQLKSTGHNPYPGIVGKIRELPINCQGSYFRYMLTGTKKAWDASGTEGDFDRITRNRFLIAVANSLLLLTPGYYILTNYLSDVTASIVERATSVDISEHTITAWGSWLGISITLITVTADFIKFVCGIIFYTLLNTTISPHRYTNL